MKKTLLFFAMVLSIGSMTAQKGSSWQKVGTEKLAGREKVRTGDRAENQRLYQVNQDQVQASLASASDRFSGQAGVQISIPNAAGQMESFLVWENSNFAPELQAKFPEIRSYLGKGITDPTASLNLSVSPIGIQTMTLRADSSSEFIQPYTKDHAVYELVDSASRKRSELPWTCSTDDVALTQELGRSAATALSNNQSFKTMRLALSCTGEYTVYFGGVANAVAAMNNTMARVNGILEKDLAIHLNLIANNDILVFPNAATDPYSAATAGAGGAWNTELQNTLTNLIGNAGYDIGHLFGASGGGGNAGCIGCVCVDDSTSLTDKNKGSGYTSPADGIPSGDNFDVDYVVHEIGHQLGANHTFSSAYEGSGVNVEPGSGSTIMGYAGIVSPVRANVQDHSDPYFTYRSILQIQNNMAMKTCPVSTAVANTPPTINAGADFTIPKGTAFILKGTGSDAQQDAITYTWEQNDDSTAGLIGASSLPSATKVSGPNFRSVNPSTSPNRYMPNFQTVLSGNLYNRWETVSSVARTLNFTLTGRDSNPTGPQTNTDAMVVSVNGTAGPFAVTYPNVANETWTQNTSKTITWNVAGTTANGINTANVNILISTDGGQSFSTLVANTSNDGSEAITVPNIAAPYCRIMVEAVGNIYYALSPSFAIGYNVTTQNTCNTYTTSPATAITGSSTNPAWAIVGQVVVPAGESVTISDLDVMVNITHQRINDLYIGLIPPVAAPTVGDIRMLYMQDCGTVITAGMNTTFDDSSQTYACGTISNGTGFYQPQEYLSQFNGTLSAGTWRLAVADLNTNFNGTLNTFSVKICSSTTTAQLSTDNFELNDFALYPNPNKGAFNVKFTPNGSNDVAINVHDIQGRKIYNKTYPAAGIFEENLQLPSVQAGIYLVTVQNGAQKTVKRIVVE
ncbi:reprolysin-like metallopeptidase [Flavobacterium sp.]|uniref:zinc-dependent metalloprotease n=1 Tax=Flavobacterium sp. TaxID=239 RepID=UPI0012146204|nr:zinc-dependent metalloprotease family protein [Flavobacterium sp.]RZJ73321.1 MAG: T9SS type A sorting domain-containing protein [Flavobacterium sp.]